jgi:hypothetical protein
MAEAKAPKAEQKWTVLATLSYPDASGKTKTVEAGAVVSDIPSISVKWLVAQGAIKEI